MLIVAMFYASFGLVGFSMFGAETKKYSNILNAFHHDQLVQIVCVADKHSQVSAAAAVGLVQRLGPVLGVHADDQVLSLHNSVECAGASVRFRSQDAHLECWCVSSCPVSATTPLAKRLRVNRCCIQHQQLKQR